MKRKALLFLFFFYSMMLTAQTTSYTVSMSGIAEIKIGMTKAALEKLLNQTIKLPPPSKENNYTRDSATCSYNGLNLSIVFEKQEINNKSEIVVWEVKSTHPQLKTRSGIGIGDDKLKIISTYEGYTIYIMPDYDDANFTIKSKTKSTIWLHGDESGKVIIFYLTNNKVTGMCVTYDEGC
jgi:hypothetical protein